MKLCTFEKGNNYHLGVETDLGIIDLKAALSEKESSKVSTTITEVIEGGKEAISALQEYLGHLEFTEEDSFVLNKEEVKWGPAVTQPSKIICVGLNYRKHADETNAPYPEVPILFNKFDNTLTGHKKSIAVPKVTNELDYEVELGIVIGEKAKNVSKKEALNYVFGYTTANDLSARDLQMKTPQWLLGKTCDDFSPLGPYLVTKDEIENPQDLNLKTIVNGEVRQDSNTSDMIFSCEEIVSYISQHMTLVPGDIILTGTPEGVVLGYPEDERNYLKPGDEVTVEIEKLGALTNKFVKE